MRMPVTTADPHIPSERVSAFECARRFTKPPRNVTMLTREFINDSLYNPAYGYFSKQALIFSPRKGFDFSAFRDSADFLKTIGRHYQEMESELDDVRNIPRQLWHTPTELLKPWYGYSVARHIINQYKAERDSRQHNEPLVVYEMGGGNGTLMVNVLDYIREQEPEIYNRMTYNLIEISTKLAKKQLRRQAHQSSVPHSNVNIINKSILDWSLRVDDPCFFVAMEVIDNFAHDVVRYDFETGEPYQAFVRVYDDGEFEEFYESVSDPLISDYLNTRASLTNPPYRSPALSSALYRRIRRQLPLAPNLTKPEFIPTQAFQFCRVLGKYFPRHRLVLSDFYKLPETVPNAVDAPVVQTRFSGVMVPCETYLVQPGWFDIFFPTNFELLKQMYDSICRKKPIPGSDLSLSRICTQHEFAKANAYLDKTRTRSGENPMLDFYENNKFLLS
ncbi:hypothetical protein GGI25_000551 [Coemansia spiralis]|uniref:Protein arginine methyltransferase NDUFAF7 n=2 Tax=Coemansia TaxID=4863 RepID=A0A9W8GC82_9FUNG|nr:hypothetical protein EDC05_000380 [Coemansia umbellata]KAJ2625455.1 hypothetical protein GGI26_000595 [Coemansia sp. RSA 1358]KAJ2680578.1 hypothetical protein GGI25_000551 [Coemansia spiralis]